MKTYRAPEPFCNRETELSARYEPLLEDYQGWLASRRGAPRRATTPAPPQLTGGERPVTLLARDGKLIEVPARRGYGGDSAFIDWLNFTVDESSFYWGDKETPIDDDQLILNVSVFCEKVFGYGITLKRDRMANFYHKSWELGEGYGLVCYGGQRDTVLISVSGTGLHAARDGWEKRLYDFLEQRAIRPRITRVDLAHDDYEGKVYSVDKALEDYRAGLFGTGGRMPDCEFRGNWEKPNGKGRTFYVGNRKNGKFARVYEKGRQLGCEESEWVRIEGELKAIDRDIPHDVLLDAGAYLAAMYPAFGFINKRQRRIETKQKEAVFSYQKMLDWLRHQCGAALNFACEIEGSADALLALIVKTDQYPRQVKHVGDWSTCARPIYQPAAMPA
jgi:phage replication initiation protein